MLGNHLERAHIIGQRYPYAHTFVHWKMLKFGFKIKNRREILGQIPRLIFGGVKSFVGKIPVGNPGGANVPALKAFPIDKEIEEIFVKAKIIWDDFNIFDSSEKLTVTFWKRRKKNHNNVFVLTGVNAQFFVVTLVLLEWNGNNLRG